MNYSKPVVYDDGLLIRRGKPAGTLTKNGYVRVRINGQLLMAHRLIWEMFNGPIPEGFEIDHINHVRTDNRIENLRLVTHADNAKNQSIRKNNKTGRCGVSWKDSCKKWCAQISVNGKVIHLGLFSSFNKAVSARKKADVKYEFHENHGDKL